MTYWFFFQREARERPRKVRKKKIDLFLAPPPCVLARVSWTSGQQCISRSTLKTMACGQTTDRVWSHFQTLRRSPNILRYPSYFQLSSRCSEIGSSCCITSSSVAPQSHKRLEKKCHPQYTGYCSCVGDLKWILTGKTVIDCLLSVVLYHDRNYC